MTQHYVGTKQVMAWEQEKDGKSGYGVKYSDDYVSWSPKETFESAYIPVGHIGHLPDYQQRVICELAQLTDKVEKLSSFTESEGFSKIDDVQSGLLSAQLDLMKAYASVLKNRISAF